MSELRTMLEDTVNRLFTEMVMQELLEEAEAGVWPEELWRTVEETGLTRPHKSEEAGGAGASWADAYVIVRAVGRHTVPLPIAETILAAWLLESAGIDVPDGPLTLLPSPFVPSLIADEKLSVGEYGVPWGKIAKHAVFIVDGPQSQIGLIETSAAKNSPGENIAKEPRDVLEFEDAPILAIAPAELPALAMHMFGAMIRAGQMAGALESLLVQSVQYAGERVQFGRPISKFQAVQQDLARLAGEVAAADIAAQAAFRAADRVDAAASFDDPNSPFFEIAAAKIRAGDAVDMATSIAHQVHGAIGFTYEHRLHFATRRLWSWRAEFGGAEFWAQMLGTVLKKHGADGLWPAITSR